MGRLATLRFCGAACAALTCSPIASAAVFQMGVDVPATLGGTDYQTTQVVRHSEGSYAVSLALPADQAVAGLHLTSSGSRLLAFRHAVDVAGATFETRDVAELLGGTYTMRFDGSAAGVPADAAIDALLVDSGGGLVMSFDAPVRLSGIEYLPADLVRHDAATGAFSAHFTGSTAGLGPDVNVVAAARTSGGALVLGFDAPVTLGGTTYLPGDLVRMDAGVASLHFRDPAWPPHARMCDVALAPGPGATPDGDAVPGVPLMARKVGTDVILTWGTSCSAVATDYAVYEGGLGSFYSHAAARCTTSGALTATLTTLGATGSSYYLVVPRSQDAEGSYGVDSAWQERPPATTACRPRIVEPCP